MVIALLVACASEPLIEDYDATCDAPADCVAVVDQGYCGRCDAWDALSVDGAAAFEADQERYGDVHRCRETILIGCTDLPSEPVVTCDAGTCVVE